ncbi:MAG: hypothetical protein ACUVXJ_09325 [Phycisphaerae bacterium]
MTSIESGSTLDQRVRTGIFFLLCAGMGVWFGYDGWVGYPAKNLAWWADQKLPRRPENLSTNPLATKANLSRIDVGATPEQIRQLLGEPALDMPRTLTYTGMEVTVEVKTDENSKVLDVQLTPVQPGKSPPNPGVLVTRLRAEMVKTGMTEDAVRSLLGDPASVRDRMMCYIGPAAYAEYQIVNGNVAAKPVVLQNEHRSESSILWQKAIAVCVGALTIYALLKFWAAIRLRVVVDDEGMTYNGRRISYDSMTRLKTDQYKDKAWVDLEYRDGAAVRMLRLDSLVIQRFNEIMRVICDRKGFVLPSRSSGNDQSDGSGLS